MRNRWIVVFLLAVFAACTAGGNGGGALGDLLIQNARIVSVSAGSPTELVDVLVGGDRILRIEETGVIRPAEATSVMDATGRFLMPGLIDSHTHLNEIPGMTFEHELAYPDVAAAAREQIPRSYLYHASQQSSI